MLNVVLLKSPHGSESHVKPFLPYIAKCDVFSIESAHMTAKRAVSELEKWPAMLRLTRTGFSNAIKQRMGVLHFENFVYKMYDYLYLNQKPIWFLERWDEASVKILHEALNSNFVKLGESVNFLASSNTEKFLDSTREALRIYNSLILLRDKNIGGNISEAEEEIRGVYPELKAKDTINLTMQLGVFHNPEKYSGDIAITTIDISSEEEKKNSFRAIESRLIGQEDPKNYSDRDLLAYILLSMAEEKRIKPLTDDEARFASFKELLRIAKERKVSA
jgi:hypothetical protein